MASFVDVCRWRAASSGTGDFVVSSAISGYQTPASAHAVNGAIYKYRAESDDLSQWEVGYGAYTSGTTTLARTTILFNSSGGTSAINFTAAPQVAFVACAEDVAPVDGAIFGLALSTAGSSSTFSVATGWCADSTAVNVMRLYSSYSKTTSAWAVGSGNGALDTGTIANSTWYHVYLIKRLDTGVVDVLISTSASSPTMPTNYTLKRRIGSMKTNGSAQWTKFIQVGDEFLWDVLVNDANAQNPGTSGTLYTLSVPTGIKVRANISILWFNVSATTYLFVSSPDITAPTVSGATNATLYSVDATHPSNDSTYIRTNTSAQVRATASGSSGSMYLNTIGWLDRRGQDD